MTQYELVKAAIEAREMAYAPYSNHTVGAALLSKDGQVFKGCNIENAGYSPTNCAERTAIFKAVSEGVKDFEAIAIVGGLRDSKKLNLCAPCGVCRQVLNEFVDAKDFKVFLAEVDKADDISSTSADDIRIHEYTLDALLPLGFGPRNLKKT